MPRAKSFVFLLISCIFNLIAFRGFSQPDTLSLSLGEAEKIFFDKNLSLVAARNNIDAAKAQVLQAKLWNNPVIMVDQSIYNPSNKKYFDVSPQGQSYIQLQELFRIAGKRHKMADLQETGKNITEYQFYDLLRNLKSELRNDYYSLAELQHLEEVYNGELRSISTLVKALNVQLKNGNASQKELLRVKAIQYGLQTEYTNYNNEINDLEADLRLLMQLKQNVYFKAQYPQLKPATRNLSLDSLFNLALSNRADLLVEKAEVDYQAKNLTLQRSLAYSDLAVGAEYDRASNYIPNYYGLTLSFNLPVFNRNQGNIEAAKFAVKSSQAIADNSVQKVESEVTSAYFKVQDLQKFIDADDEDFYEDFETQFKKLVQAYEKREITLIEFVDFFDSYKDTKVKILDNQANLQKAREQLNFVIGTDIF